MHSKEIIYQNKRLHYKIGGSGNPVVLLHGFAEDHQVWKHQLDELEKDFKIIAPDLPGSGLSEALEIENLAIEDLAKAIDAIIEAENIQQFILIGHSMGGYITLAFEHLYSKKIKAIGLFHSTCYGDSEIKIQNRKKSIDFIKNNGSESFLKTIVPDLYFDQTKELHQIESHLSIANKISSSTLIQYYHAMINRTNHEHLVKTINKPVLFIGGSNDNLIPIEQTIKESCLSDCSFITILKISGHMGMIEEHKKTNQTLNQFIHFVNK
jgi:pimeloyl-ACP methyl ester carboxylesterase